MPSFNVINYSIRPSKSIQRQVVFDCLSKLSLQLPVSDATYIGFGSVWFTDFVLAHNRLGIDRMLSIEGDEIGFRRADFNKPYSVVEVHHGHSNEVIPTLLADDEQASVPWIVWLDYDYELNESIVDDLQNLIQKAPSNSVLIFTLNAVETKYGPAKERPDYLRQVLGDVVPDDLARRRCKEPNLQRTLAELSNQFLQSIAANINRPGGFIPAFNIAYKDGASMVTFGGVLPDPQVVNGVKTLVEGDDWPGLVDQQIEAPHLTVKEASELQSLLPTDAAITREQVQELGFDLSDEEIAVFQMYYKKYPSFAQVVL